MPNYFEDCHTPEEVKTVYRELAKKFHPDKGGTDAKFRELQEQYEERLQEKVRLPKLPPLHHVDKLYEYHRKKVRYNSSEVRL